MRVYTRGGDLPFKTFSFPDGQPHFQLLHRDEFQTCTIEAAIRTSDELMQVLMAKDVLSQYGYHAVSLDIRYLLAARMDRAMSVEQPFTLAIVCRVLLGAGFKTIRVLDPHSSVSTKLLGAEAVYPLQAIRTALSWCPVGTVLIAPDAGAGPRVDLLRLKLNLRDQYLVLQGLKHRDAAGNLSGFGVASPSLLKGHECLILDDLCDGGRTFEGLADVLLDEGAPAVHLYVTHGIFSKGVSLKGIDRIFTTNSYQDIQSTERVICADVQMKDL